MFPRLTAIAGMLMLVLPAGTAAAEKPLRILTFDVTYFVVTSQENHISGLGALAGQGASNESHGFAVDDAGVLSVDVIAATGDGGLVVDTRYDGKTTRQPTVRIAIASDGSLGYDPKANLSGATLRVLPFLARGLVKDRELRAGVSWSIPILAPASGSTTYRVTHVEAPVATIAITTDVTVKGPQGFDQHEDGTLVYEVDRLVPQRVDEQMRLHRFSIGGTETTDTHVVVTLEKDSLGPAR
jgi:hypothetical protein